MFSIIIMCLCITINIVTFFIIPTKAKWFNLICAIIILAMLIEMLNGFQFTNKLVNFLY